MITRRVAPNFLIQRDLLPLSRNNDLTTDSVWPKIPTRAATVASIVTHDEPAGLCSAVHNARAEVANEKFHGRRKKGGARVDVSVINSLNRVPL